MITRLLGKDLESKQVASVAIHPGWMATDMGGTNAPVCPTEAAASILDFIRNITMDKSGKFCDIHGNVVPW